MESGNKFKSVAIISLVIILTGASVATAWFLGQRGTRPVAPSVPESKPKAADDLPDNITPEAGCYLCQLSGTPTTVPPAATLTLQPTSTTAPPVATSTPSSPAPSLTVTPKPPTPTTIRRSTSAPMPTNEPLPTTIAELPKAGIRIPTLGGILGGFLLMAVGLALIF